VGAHTHITLGARLLTHSHDAALGAANFDDALYAHLLGVAAQKHKSMADLKLAPGSRRDLRLLAGCERLRKLLSTLPVAHATVENLSEDAGDVNFSVTAQELAAATPNLVARLEELVAGTLTVKGADGERVGLAASEVAALEMWGGGARMPLAHSVLTKVFGSAVPIGAKLEDSSIALGAALLFGVHGAASSAPAASAEGVRSQFSVEEIEAAAAHELAMQQADRDIQAVLSQRNVLEAFVLDCRQRSSHPKLGQLISADSRRALDALLDATEDWLWGDCATASVAEVEAKFTAVRAEADGLCSEYLAAVAKDKADTERELEVQAKLAEAQRVAEGGTEDGADDDHDNRKLKKPDRLRLVMKNKDEGTELFKGGNFRPACARYQKALTHCCKSTCHYWWCLVTCFSRMFTFFVSLSLSVAKFFDLSPADEKEITALKVTLYSNLAACYIKLENWDNVIKYSTDAIELDERNAKCYFRRSAAWEAKKDWDKALKDAQTCVEVAEHADKAFDVSVRRIKKEMDKIKSKEKKMAQKMFS
jgi:tetratricopeptide (TPR) repeat protein